MSFQELSVAIETVRIDEELMEIWPNEVCDNVEENRGQGVIRNGQKWCRCSKEKEREVVHPRKRKA